MHYALAETSAAPRAEIFRSGLEPSVHICSIVKGEREKVETHTIPALFRTEFDALVREQMYFALQELYQYNGN